MTLLSIRGLTMRFGGLTAVEKLDLDVESGQIVAVIGPNGAGKTTVFNAVTGIYEPTSGHILFQGQRLTRPWTWHVVVMAVLAAVATGLAAMVLAVNVDKLWRAAIKRTNNPPHTEFTYRAAWDEARLYLSGQLALERTRSGRWLVSTGDGGRTLATLPTREEADQARRQIAAIMRLDGNQQAIRQSGDVWQIVAPGASEVLAEFPTAEAAQARLTDLTQLARQEDGRRFRAWAALLFGLVLGATGYLAIWNRSRRTADIIACGGIARTFQNIRLFQNMTVAENVLVALDRQIRYRFVSMLLRLPVVRRQEEQAMSRSRELLKFFGLEDQAGSLAKNLPYGDQRRLEIARALATSPQLLLLDEPAAGMNPSETSELMGLIRRIRDSGQTILLIEHHMNLVMGISDRIAVLDYGVKIAEGPPEAIRRDPKVIAAYLGTEEVH